MVWGLVHHFLQPPFAVAVQLSTAVLSACPAGLRDTATKRKRDELETRQGSASHCVGQLPILAAVHITELMDEWTSDPVKRLKLKVGQMVKLRLLPVLEAEQVQQEMKQQKAKSRSGLPLEASMRLSVVEGTLREHQGKRKATDPGDQHSLQFSDLEVSLSSYVVGCCHGHKRSQLYPPSTRGESSQGMVALLQKVTFSFCSEEGRFMCTS